MSATPEAWSVLRLLQWTTNYLNESGSSSPRLEAEILLAYALQCSRVDLYTRFDFEPTQETRDVFKGLIRKRAEGCPVAYLVGKKEFYSLDFFVDESVLIPRPETEFLIMELFDCAKEFSEGMNAPIHICDVGTGSGILAIVSAIHLKNAHVVALDISPTALATAKKNADLHKNKIQSRVEFHQSDRFSALKDEKYDAFFDFIVSNPPYVGKNEIESALESSVYRYEPHVALFGGEKGTEWIAEFLPQVPRFLKPGGMLLMEVSPMIHEEVVTIIRQTPDLVYEKTIRDLDRQERIIRAKKTDFTKGTSCLN
ncbi:MAG: peptide chain release factor N(5)-glutamine methyltransferase [Planctomycetia bacterium]|nr:peptide chain release factor N(5)-glutamine methyltransferase [Planctomycetia bacterium]